MASSNRHWPSLFKSKPCNPCNAHHQWQHDINTASLLSNPCQKPPFASPGGGTEERTPEPKPRWNPKPEQIRILEAIFNSGMVNPPRDEIRRIRVQLQEYGQVGDANVFYWFQNRKSRSKHKQRQLQSRQQQQQQQQPRSAPNVISVTTASSSSSSSDPSNSSGCSDKTLTSLSSKTTSITGTAGGGMMELSNNSPTASVNQTFFTPGELPLDQFFFHAHAHAQAQAHVQAQAQGYNCNISPVDLSLSSLVATEPQAILGLRSGFWSELMMNQPQPAESGCKNISTMVDGNQHHLVVMDETKGKMQQQFHSNNIYSSPAPIATASTTAPIITAASVPEPPPSPTPALPQGPQGPQCSQPPPSPPPAVTATTTTATGATKDASLLSASISEMLQGIGVPTMVVFINEEAYEVGVGPLNVKLAFGLDAVLFHSSGLPVLVDDWGVTLHPLQNGASYYVV